MDTTLLMVIDRAPYGDWRGREVLDMAFSLAAFDQPVALLFRGEGVNWLRAGQEGDALQQKTVSRNLGAAKMFGVSEIYADDSALVRFNLSKMDPEAVAVSPNPTFYRQFRQVVQL